MELALKIAAIGITGAFCALTIRKQVPEISMVVAMVVGAFLLFTALTALTGVMDFLDELTELAGLSPSVVTPMVKTAGIAIVTRCVSALCKDAGESGIASMVETAGAVAALLVALPLMKAVLQTLIGLLRT